MDTVNHIIFPTDFSENSINAFQYAIEIAQHRDLKLQVVHIVQPELEPMDLPVIAAEAMQAKTAAAEVAMQAFIAPVPDTVDVQASIEFGLPGDLVPDMADDKEGQCLILLGTRRKHNLLDKYLGSVSAAIMRKADCPVIVIPPEAVFRPLRNLVFATELRESDTHKVLTIMKLFKQDKPQIHCVHIDENKNTEIDMSELQKDFEDHISKDHLHFYKIPMNDNVLDTLNERVSALEADMVVMLRSERNFLGRIFSPSLAKRMLYHTHIPLMVLE